jgi:hypothetical protein
MRVREANHTEPVSTASAYPERRGSSNIQTVWNWVLRLCLPILMVVSVKALQWLWVDNIYGTRWLDIIGGTALALGLLSIALWCVGVWLSDADDPKKS